MKRTRKLVGFLLAAVLLFAQSLSVFAGEVTYKGNGDFEFAPGTDMSETTLFEDFENAMPGDVLTQEITVKNNSDASDYIKVYLQAVPHDEEENPLETGVKDTETIESMQDFLKQLSMTVTNNKTGEEIFNASPDQTDGLTDKIYLGSLKEGESLKLTAELSVPIDLGNEYAGRSGEVDWIFTVEELNEKPSIKTEKTVTSTPADGNAYKLGETIKYEIKVTNNGDQLLKNIVVADDLTGDKWTIDELEVGASKTFTTEYKVTEDDIIAGSVVNTATAKGTPDNPDLPDVEDPDTNEEPNIDPSNPHLNVEKSVTSTPADGKAYKVGEKIVYEIKVMNDGNLTIKDIEVNDDLTGDEWTIAELSVGESKTFTTEYTITEADVINGSVENVATAKGKSEDPDNPDPKDPGNTDTPTEQSKPHMTVTKTVTSKPDNGTYYVVGEKIDYKITVKNDGNLTIKDITVKDELTGLNKKIGSLAPGQEISIETSYTVTEKDIVNGGVTNNAKADGTTDDPDNPDVPAEDDTFSPTDPSSPHMKVEKTVTNKPEDGKGYNVGEKITYDIKVTNDGNVTLNNVKVTDDLTGFSSMIAALAPGASETFNTEYTVTEADVIKGSVKNLAKAKAETDDPEEPEIEGPGETETPTASKDSHMTLVKTVTSIPANGSYYVAGEKIEYKITVTNDGNLTLKDIVVKDEMTGLDEKITSLAPGAIKEFTTSHTVVEADMLAGGVVNEATATAKSEDPDNPEVPADDKTFSPTDPVSPHVSIEKEATSKSKLSVGYETGETVKYTITVLNDGNLTLHNLKVTDSLTGDEWIIEELAIGVEKTFNVSYKVTEKDAKQGTIKNTATISGDPDDPAMPPIETDTVIVKTVPKAVNTGDTSNPALWSSFMGVAAIGLGMLIVLRKKQSRAV